MLFETFLDLLSHYKALAPDRPALVYEANGEPAVFSYAELHDAVAAAMPRFAGSRSVGFLIGESTKDTIIDLFAAVSAGARAVLLDENVPEEVLGRLIRLTEADTLVGDRGIEGLLSCAEGGRKGRNALLHVRHDEPVEGCRLNRTVPAPKCL